MFPANYFQMQFLAGYIQPYKIIPSIKSKRCCLLPVNKNSITGVPVIPEAVGVNIKDIISSCYNVHPLFNWIVYQNPSIHQQVRHIAAKCLLQAVF